LDKVIRLKLLLLSAAKKKTPVTTTKKETIASVTVPKAKPVSK